MASTPLLLTPEDAIRWEFRRRLWMQLPAVVAAQMVLPVILLLVWLTHALRTWLGTGRLPPLDELPHQLHLVLMVIQLLVTVLMVVTLVTPSFRHFTLPMSTGRLIRTQLLSGIAAVGLTLFATTAVVNLLWWTNYPLIAPALYGAAALSVGAVLEMKYRGRQWMTLLWGSVFAGGFYLALLGHFYSGWSFMIEHAWSDMTASECAALVMLTAGGVWLAPSAAQRLRLGVGPGPATDLAAISLQLPASLRDRHPAITFVDWELRTQTGALIVTGIAFGVLIFGTALAAFFADLWENRGQTHMPFVEPTFMISIGIYIGSGLLLLGVSPRGRQALVGTHSSRWSLLLPLSDTRMADLSTLAAFIGSVLGAGCLFLLGVVTHLLIWATLSVAAEDTVRAYWERNLVNSLWNVPGWNHSPSYVLGAAIRVLAVGWGILGVCQAAMLTGRRGWACLPFLALLGMPFLMMFSSVLLGMRFANEMLMPGLFALATGGLSLAGVAGVVSHFARPWRRLIVASVLWIVVATLLVATEPDLSISAVWLITCATGVTLPLTLPPLALRSFRHAE